MLRRLLLGLFALAASTARAQEVGLEAAPAPRLSVAVLPVVATGVDPIVPQRVMETVVTTVRELGYDLVPEPALLRAIAAVRVDDAPSPSEVWRVTVLSGGQRGVSVRVTVQGDAYVGELFVASADGSGPFRAEFRGDGGSFLGYAAEAVRRTLPAPSTYDAEAASRYSAGAQTQASRPAPPSWSTATFARSYARPAAPRPPRYGLTFVTESAFGRAQDARFYHHGLGARVDFAFGENVVVGLFGGYLNLDLGDRRGSNLLFFAQLEDRLQFVATGRARFPLRVAFGYVPFNGPFLRFSGGLRFPVGGPFELGLDLLAPTFWWVPGDRRVTYDVSAELTYRFGPSR